MRTIQVRKPRGFISQGVMLLTTVVATAGVAMLDIQNAHLRDQNAIVAGGQAKFMAQSGLQEAFNYVTKIGGGWTGTSGVQQVTHNGVNIGAYEYTVSAAGNTYTVTSTGYVPSKTAPGKTSYVMTDSFTYTVAIPSSGGIVVLSSNEAGALTLSGNGTLTLYGGKVTLNSSAAGGLAGSGNATLKASQFDIVGPSVNLTANAKISGTVNLNQSPVSDPLASLPVPDPATLTTRKSAPYSIGSNTKVTIEPGVYKGGIAVSGNAVVTMNPGIYYIESASKNSGFSVSGNGVLTGNGVTIYVDGVNANNKVSLSGNGAITVTPPTSGTYKGVSFFQSRTSTNPVNISGNGNTKMGGALYFAGAQMNISGNGSNIGSLNVVKKLNISGNGSISVNNY